MKITLEAEQDWEEEGDRECMRDNKEKRNNNRKQRDVGAWRGEPESGAESRPGQMFLCQFPCHVFLFSSAACVGFHIINLLKDNMELEQTCI